MHRHMQIKERRKRRQAQELKKEREEKDQILEVENGIGMKKDENNDKNNDKK